MTDVRPTTVAPPRPRPRAVVGALLAVAGAAAMVVGVLLPWFAIDGVDGVDADGFAEFAGADDGTSGTTFVALAVVGGAVGLLTLVGRRVVPVAVAGVIVGVIAAVLALRRRGDLDDAADRYVGVITVGPGTTVVAAGAIAVAVGSLLVVATRRRRP